MSEQTIARWNAIALERPAEPSSLKRGRPDDDEDSDDDVSLVSRSPSPVLNDSMDVDEVIHKYDQYVRRPTPEVITVDTKIKPTNKGFALLSKLGWVEGQPVGLSPDGRTEPVPFHIKADLTGLGKTDQDFEMIETTVSQRRGLDSERQQKETEEQRRHREDAVARTNALKSEISSTLRAFYCELCDKQFKTVAQYDEHTNSYAHHHKVRFQDMQANARLKSKEDVDKRKEKERKREEKELRKIAAANGIKMPKPSTVSSLATPLAPTPDVAPASTSMDIDGTPIEPKKGWTSISSAEGSSGSSSGGFKKSGWATVGSASSSAALAPPVNSNAVTHTGPHGHSVPSASSSPSSTAYHGGHSSHTPTFRNAGWTFLDTGSSELPPAAGTASIGVNDSHNSSSVSSPQGGWARTSTSSAGVEPSSDSSRKWSTFATAADPLPFAPSEPTPQPPPPVPPPSLLPAAKPEAKP
ncbi:unnamed protein product [Cyclocybe aegerita]|uniref:G-patch domain-containing protein n=1 Tax=Cyclocybe aegerita TaxID=1973307 RepID=A0A8S0WKM0_CYCAE|nr:unnamed protein product [Cyclocybe aegerita]